MVVAVTSSRPTAMSRTTRGLRTSAVRASRSGVAEISIGPRPPKIAIVVMPVSGALRPRAVPSDAACAAVAPGLSLAMASNIDRLFPEVGMIRKGTHARVSRSG